MITCRRSLTWLMNTPKPMTQWAEATLMLANRLLHKFQLISFSLSHSSCTDLLRTALLPPFLFYKQAQGWKRVVSVFTSVLLNRFVIAGVSKLQEFLHNSPLFEEPKAIELTNKKIIFLILGCKSIFSQEFFFPNIHEVFHAQWFPALFAVTQSAFYPLA